MSNTMTFRSDLQGLRAIAILLVVLAHAGYDVFEGGFIGVDIFFVDLTKAAMGDDGAGGVEHHIAAGRAGGSEAKLDGVAGAVGHLGRDRALPDQLVGPGFGLGHLLGYIGGELESIAGRSDSFVRLLSVLYLRGVVPGSIREEGSAVALPDHGASRVEGGGRQGGGPGQRLLYRLR